MRKGQEAYVLELLGSAIVCTLFLNEFDVPSAGFVDLLLLLCKRCRLLVEIGGDTTREKA
jgi:hypothetical protein